MVRSKRRLHDIDRRPNGDVKPKDVTRRTCPVDDLFKLWGIVVLCALCIPLFAKTIPVSERTDLRWWMTGVVYLVPSPPAGNGTGYFQVLSDQLEDLHSLGVQALRLQDFFPADPEGSPLDFYSPNPRYGNFNQFENFVNKLDVLGLKLIVDVPLAFTSTAHPWFWEDRKQKADSSVYIWSDRPIQDDTDPDLFTTLWGRDDSRPQFYQYSTSRNNSALLNYASKSTLTLIKHVLERWLRYGVDGFVFLEYDTIQLRNSTAGDGVNHIQTEDPATVRLNQLGNLTASFRQLFDYYQEEYEGTMFFAVALSSTSQPLWHAVYEAGADVIINPELVLSQDTLTTGEVNPYWLRNRVGKALARVPQHYHHTWQLCGGDDDVSIREEYNFLNMVHMIQLFLPGSSSLCQAQVAKLTRKPSPAATLVRDLLPWRSTTAMCWGAMETTLVDDSIFSYVRFAHGKIYDRFLIVTNFATTPQHRNFTLKNSRLKIPDLGFIQYSSCAREADDIHPLDSLIYLNDSTIHPQCGLLIKLKLDPFL